MSLKVFTLSVLDPQERVKGCQIGPGHTENPRWVHRSRYIPDHRKPPASPKKDVNEECGASRERSELVLHDQLTV